MHYAIRSVKHYMDLFFAAGDQRAFGAIANLNDLHFG